MSVIRIALAVLITAGIRQPALAGPAPASPQDNQAVATNLVTPGELVCDFQRYIAFRQPDPSARPDDGRRILAPVPCSGR